jgi:hypothetical protein
VIASSRGADIRLRIPCSVSEPPAPGQPRRRRRNADPHLLRSSQVT